MISKLSKVAAAAVLAAVMWPTAPANAACITGLSDTTSVDCKNALACQNTIHKEAVKFINAVQNKVGVKLINDTQKGTQLAKPLSKCVGGPNNGKVCKANNGICKSTVNKGKVCAADTDCQAVPVVGDCNRAANTGCNTGGPNDVGECQVDTAKSAFAKDYKTARDNMQKNIIKKCNTAPTIVDPADLGLTNLATCPGIGAAPTAAEAYSNLVECITDNADGDLASGKVVDTTLNVFGRTTGTGNLPPRGKKLDPAPRAILQFGGSQVLQVGTTLSADPVSGGGGITLLSGASCTNGNTYCTKDSECTNDALGVADNCTANSDADAGCLSGLPCRSLTAAGPGHVTPPNGNILTVSATCASGVGTCLVTRTQVTGNGTPADGFVNFTTGEFGTTAPIKTEVTITGLAVDCSTFVACPSCVAGLCASGLTPGGACTASPDTPTQECLPTAPAAVVPNPFSVSTEPKNMTANMAGQFCGFCDSSLAAGCQNLPIANSCSTGCQVAGDCVGTIGGTVCDYGSSGLGFQGDAAVTSITADGVRNQYAPLATGLFCTGVTGNPTIDGSAGLPGPVRVVLPYIQGYIHSQE